MILYTFAHHTLFGIPFLHVEHVLIGMGLAVIIMIPSSILLSRRARKQEASQTAKEVQGSKHQAHTEKIKSDIILAAIDDGVVVIGADKVIQIFNQGAATITGWPSAEAENLEYHSVLKLVDGKGEAYSDNQDPFTKVFQTKAAYRDNQATLVTRSERQLPVHISVSPLLDNDNNVTAVVGIFRDVSQERAEEAQRAEFISTASHEMRTPVAAIEGYLALVLNTRVTNIDAKAREYLEKAHSSTQHLGKLFQDLLTSAKAEDGRLVNHPQIVEIGGFLEQMVDNLRFAAEKKGLLMEFLVGSGTASEGTLTASTTKIIRPLYYAYVDSDRLQEVVSNLFDNAVKYTDSGKISIGVTGDDKVVQFYIRDTGAGIPPEDVPHLFQKFYRVDDSITRSIGGTGLGLFISSKIIELNKGRIWVESEIDKGTTVYINLPRLDTEKATTMQAVETKVTSPLES